MNHGKFCVLTVTIVVTLFIAACAPEQSEHPMPQAAAAPIVEPIDRGNGVYYFESTGSEYMQMLSKFYEEKPFLHCDMQGFTEQMSVYNRGRYTETTGFILHCHDIAIPAQDVTVP